MSRIISAKKTGIRRLIGSKKKHKAYAWQWQADRSVCGTGNTGIRDWPRSKEEDSRGASDRMNLPKETGIEIEWKWGAKMEAWLQSGVGSIVESKI